MQRRLVLRVRVDPRLTIPIMLVIPPLPLCVYVCVCAGCVLERCAPERHSLASINADAFHARAPFAHRQSFDLHVLTFVAVRALPRRRHFKQSILLIGCVRAREPEVAQRQRSRYELVQTLQPETACVSLPLHEPDIAVTLICCRVCSACGGEMRRF